MSKRRRRLGSALLNSWARWREAVGRGWTALAGLPGRLGDGPDGLAPAARARVIDSLAEDLDCLTDDLAGRGATERSAEELLLTDALLGWLRGGDLPGRGAVEFMAEHVAAFDRARYEEEPELQAALREALEELVRVEAAAIAEGRWTDRNLGVEAAADRDLRRFGRKLDELRRSRDLTIGQLAERTGLDVVTIVAFLYGADEPGGVELMILAKALQAEPRDVFPEFLVGTEDDEGRPPGDDVPDDQRGDA